MKVKRGAARLFVAALYILLIFFGVLPLIGECYQQYYGTGSVYLLAGTGLPILCSLVLPCMLLWLFLKEGLAGDFEGEHGAGLKAGFSRKKKWAACFLAVSIAIAWIVGSIFWFQRFTIDGIEYRCLSQHREYTWEEVDYLSLKADSQGVLVFEFQMADGRKCSFNGSMLWCVEYFSEGFERQFPEDVYSYARWLGQRLGSLGIPLKAEGGWEGMMGKLKYSSWKALAEDVRKLHGQAQTRTGLQE